MIRPIEKTDQEALAALIRQVFEEYGAPLVNTVYDDPHTRHVFDTVQGANAGYWVVEEDGEVLGGCGFYPTEGLPQGYAELVKLYLSPKARGKGFGSKLFSLAIDGARRAGYSHLYIESFPEFSDAVKMYERHGFKLLPHRLGNSGHTATSIHMELDLRKNLVEIVAYEPRYKQDFVRLNKEWIEAYFKLEESDLKTFENIDSYIIAQGGQVFLAREENGEIVGCCALIPHPERNCYELAKMAVSPKAQGRGVGRLLGEALLDYARRHGVKRIFLEGNTRLVASIALYRRLGFREIPMTEVAYERCDIKMELELPKSK